MQPDMDLGVRPSIRHTVLWSFYAVDVYSLNMSVKGPTQLADSGAWFSHRVLPHVSRHVFYKMANVPIIASNRNHSLYECSRFKLPPNTIWPDGFETWDDPSVFAASGLGISWLQRRGPSWRKISLGGGGGERDQLRHIFASYDLSYYD